MEEFPMKINDYVFADQLTVYLEEKGVSFDEEGFPILPSSCYATREPEYIIPWNHRKAAPDKKRTALRFFMNDNLLYPRFETIKKDIEELKEYSSFVSMDISVSRNMPIAMQIADMRLNALYSAALAIQKEETYIPSLKCGDETTLHYLNRYHTPPLVALGMHGCYHSDNIDFDDYLLRSKLLMVRPKKVLIYGKPTDRDIETFHALGIPYGSYPDFRTLCKERR